MFKNNLFKGLALPTLMGLAVAFWFGSTGVVWADVDATSPSSLGAVICNAYTQSKSFGNLFQWAAYVAGVLFALQGVHHFRGHSESAQNHPLHRPILLWFGAACLMALPSFFSMIVTSFYGAVPSAGGLPSSCQAGSVGSGAATPDVMLTNLVTNIKTPLLNLISLIAILSGLYMIIHGLMKAGKHGFDPKAHSIPSILSNIVFGALLMTIGGNLNMMLYSLFGANAGMSETSLSISSGSVLGWGFVSNLGGSQQFATAVAAALSFVQIIGAIAFVRGWMVMKKVVEGAGNVTMAQGITNIVGGVLCVNIGAFLYALDQSLGGTLGITSP